VVGEGAQPRSPDSVEAVIDEFRGLHPDFDLQPLMRHISRRRRQLAVKRALDVAGALLMILVTAPVMVAAALLVKLTSKGPVLFVQARPGRNGGTFRLLKFRSMYDGADAATSALGSRFSRPGDLVKLADDPRVTPVGRFLRKWSIDELPQLFNVLVGSMSLIGPRPVLPHMADPYPDFIKARGLVRPGMSGLWQVRERSKNTNARYMMAPDLEYVAGFSLWLDLKIALRTIPAVLIHRSTV
jgi:lipopolysaccharide/colanic/teichoic acid biosynthesis glycosyltransferase